MFFSEKKTPSHWTPPPMNPHDFFPVSRSRRWEFSSTWSSLGRIWFAASQSPIRGTSTKIWPTILQGSLGFQVYIYNICIKNSQPEASFKSLVSLYSKRFDDFVQIFWKSLELRLRNTNNLCWQLNMVTDHTANCWDTNWQKWCVIYKDIYIYIHGQQMYFYIYHSYIYTLSSWKCNARKLTLTNKHWSGLHAIFFLCVLIFVFPKSFLLVENSKKIC